MTTTDPDPAAARAAIAADRAARIAAFAAAVEAASKQHRCAFAVAAESAIDPASGVLRVRPYMTIVDIADAHPDATPPT